MAMTAQFVKRFHSLIVGSGSTSSPDTSQQVDPWAQNAAKSVYPVRKFALPSRELANVFCVRSWGVFDRQMPITVPQYDTSRKGECRLD